MRRKSQPTGLVFLLALLLLLGLLASIPPGLIPGSPAIIPGPTSYPAPYLSHPERRPNPGPQTLYPAPPLSNPENYQYPGAQTPTPWTPRPFSTYIRPSHTPIVFVILPKFSVRVRVSGLLPGDRADLAFTQIKTDERLVHYAPDPPPLEVTNGDYLLTLEEIPIFSNASFLVELRAKETYLHEPRSYDFAIDEDGHMLNLYYANRELIFRLTPPAQQTLPPCAEEASELLPPPTLPPCIPEKRLHLNMPYFP